MSKKYVPTTASEWIHALMALVMGLIIFTLVVGCAMNANFLAKNGNSIAQSFAAGNDMQAFLLRDTSSIAIRNSTKTIQFEFGNNQFQDIAISPNGATVILQARITNSVDIKPPAFSLFRLETKQMTQLPFGGFHPTFLDNDTIAYDFHEKISIVRLSDPENPAVIVAGSEPSAVVGKNSFVYRTPQNRIAEYRTSTKESILLPVEFNAFSPAVSPNGEMIVFLSRPEDIPCYLLCKRDLWIYETTSRTTRLLDSPGNKSHPVWIDNHTIIARSNQDLVLLNETGTVPIYAFAADGTGSPKLFQIYP